MSFSVNTNITSMQAQEYLRQTGDFQAKTLNRVTSGLRIVQSGDDAAGLAIANGLRSDEAVLSQGVRNANDGLSQLQTIDGGMSNISKLLDRARTLATQSATGTFTGDRSVLNNEFQNVMQEINRQSQAVGMNQGGTFAKNLSVFVGGGRGTTDASSVLNGSVNVDLRTSTVDAKSLGLDTYKAQNGTTYNLGVASDTSISKIVNSSTADANAVFVFRGAGFGDTAAGAGSQGISISVTTTGLSDTAGLAAAINQQIYNKANPGSSNETVASKAFKAAGITATIVTDSSGNEQLAFTSSSAAFQVNGANRTANAFLGNLADSRAGQVTGEGSSNITSDNALPALAADLHAAATLTFTVGGVAGNTIALTTSTATVGDSAQQIVDKLNADIQAGGTAADRKIHAELKNGKLAFTQQDGSEFTAAVDANATAVALGFTSAAGVAAKTSQFTATNSGGVFQSAQEVSAQGQTDHSNDAFKFAAVAAGHTQTLTVNAKRADGSTTGIDIKLDSTSGADVNTALNTLNDQLQSSKDPSLMSIVAVRDGAGIKFLGTQGFTVKLGSSIVSATGATTGTPEGLAETYNGTDKQGGVQLDATTQGQSGLADISNQAAAEKAVGLLAKAVASLGQAQAVIGRGQNQFSYAVNLAQSQLTNQAAAESRIRDADLTSEAANMTKAQVLLQAGVAAMAQANSAPQQILSLLRS